MNTAETINPIELENSAHISRFGDEEKILQILREGEPEVLGSLDDLFPESTPPHQQKVEYAEVKYSTEANANAFNPIIMHLGDMAVPCIFKPLDGENPDSKVNMDIPDFYTQEVMAYEISHHFKLDLVPPTIPIKINGRIGSLQLFIDPSKYRAFGIVTNQLDEDQFDKTSEFIEESDDWKKMALLDFILANCERHQDNYLIKINKDDEGKIVPDTDTDLPLIAIDHGISMSFSSYKNLALRGPSLQLTTTRSKNSSSPIPRDVPIPDHLLRLVEDGLRRSEELDFSVNANNPDEISFMWARAKALLIEKRFLSKYNIKFLPEPGNPPHPPLTFGY